ncbi:peptidylprolyl isomerase [Solimicrobium silvestre]|uniref:peptidylprolyl isomerase n=1 Tax=Solimicrobium silvestre TaxID=2099400 RepID=A0A2S9GU95_9BURK|nr:peptidylprolyl isomerase [Solimicrobium silvestre]PRC91302.1 PPIC-type PPIASE domain [Solimicrobium silvestre]
MTFKPAHLLLVLLAFATAPVMAQNVAVVNGTAIPSSRVEEMVKQITSQANAPQDSPDLRLKIKDELITREILIQAADKLGLAKTTEVKAQLEIARQSIMIRALVNDFVKKNPITDAEISAEYEKIKVQAGDKEYHVRHILVATADEAKAIIAKLKAGSTFDELAKQSKDTGSANNGGDLDWATPAAFVKPFSDAMVGLQKGQMTETPVQTQYGFHVIKVDDTRPAKIPTLDELKKQIVEGLEQKKLQAYQEELHKKAVIK